MKHPEKVKEQLGEEEENHEDMISFTWSQVKKVFHREEVINCVKALIVHDSLWEWATELK